jgi:rod shape-determining protein MreC
MPVITPDGVVGKVLSVYGETAQLLLINDPTSGVGAILVNSRLQGVVKGTPTGEVQLSYIMGDEPVQPGEALITAGGDRVFPKGLPIGTVAKVSMGRTLFLDIKVKPAADLDRLEEVLVITSQKARTPDATGLGPIRAADILANHLPGLPQTPPQAPPQTQQTPPSPTLKPAPTQTPAGGAAAPSKPAPVSHVPAPGASQNPSASKPQTIAPATGASAAKPQTAKPAAKPAGSNGSTAAQPSAPKTAAPKPPAPNADGSKPKPAAIEGTHPQ